MENFMFSVNATLPIFFVILIGYLLRQKGILTDSFVSSANRFNFNVTLPLLLYRDIAGADIADMFDWKYVLFCMIVTTVSFFGIWGLTKIFLKDKTMTGAFVQASFRGSAAILGIAFIQNIYGHSGMAPLMIIGTVPFYNIYSVIVLTFEANHDGKKNIKKAILNITKNPIIIGIFAGLLVSLCRVRFPVVINKTVDNFASMASPLALAAIGAGFEGKKALAKIKPTVAASIIKLLILPAIFLPAAAMFGFHDQKMVALLVMLGAPTTASSYIMAKNMKNDGVLTSSIVVATTLFSAVTLTGWIYILKTRGLV